jgi:fructose transport system substrate-binding protein
MAKFINRRSVGIVAASAAALSVTVGLSASHAAPQSITVSLILKDETNPFFAAMAKGAVADGAKVGVKVVVGAGKADGDSAGQVALIENAIANKEQGILITPSNDGVDQAILKARKAGLVVIALDTPPVTKNIVTTTFATDNFAAGTLIGQYAATALKGKNLTIAMIDDTPNVVTNVDLGRDEGFLNGMGIKGADPKMVGKEPKTGSYSGGKYTICGHVAGKGDQQDGQTGMEQLIAKCPNINLVYAINDPDGIGAFQALKAAGKTAMIVAVDGGAGGIAAVKAGQIAATSQQYPLLMASLGVDAIKKFVTTGVAPKPDTVRNGISFFNTGVNLITDKPMAGVPSKSTAYGTANAW